MENANKLFIRLVEEDKNIMIVQQNENNIYKNNIKEILNDYDLIDLERDDILINNVKYIDAKLIETQNVLNVDIVQNYKKTYFLFIKNFVNEIIQRLININYIDIFIFFTLIIPIILIWVGVDFSSQNKNFPESYFNEPHTISNIQLQIQNIYPRIINYILVTTTIVIGYLTFINSFLYYYFIENELIIPIFGTSLFLSSSIHIIREIIPRNIIFNAAKNSRYFSFTFIIIRIFNSTSKLLSILLTYILLTYKIKLTRKKSYFILSMILLFYILLLLFSTLYLIYFNIPQTYFPQNNIPKPFHLINVILFLFALIFLLFLRNIEKTTLYMNGFIYTLFFDIMIDLCTVFSRSFDSYFNVSFYYLLISFIIPCLTLKYIIVKKLLNENKITKKLSETKTMFLANMSHELKTPLSNIIGLSEILTANNKDDQSEQYNYFNDINISAQNLLNIINDILLFSKLSNDKIILEKNNFKINTMFSAIKSLIKTYKKNKNITIRYNIPSINYYLNGDYNRIIQIILNLLTNALKFSFNNDDIIINVNYKILDNEQIKLFFQIKDNGIGIPKNKLRKIFNSFEQSDDSTTRNYGGTGLGLTICNNLIYLMNGHLMVKTKENNGTEFTFMVILNYFNENNTHLIEMTNLNFDNNNKKNNNSNLKMIHINNNINQTKKNYKLELYKKIEKIQIIKILLIDDDEISLKLLETLLFSMKNIICFKATNLKTAEDIYKNEKDIKLIITDLNLPDGLSLSLCKKIKNNNNKILLVSGSSKITNYKQSDYIDDILDKPYTSIQLYEKILNIINI
jgi:signal transduction histidine kinase/CheY-like chemotaxis protein